MTDYDLPIDWETFTADEKARWYTQERARRQHARQSTVSVEERIAVHERRQTTIYCTGCGEEHTALHEAALNYCRQCGTSL